MRAEHTQTFVALFLVALLVPVPRPSWASGGSTGASLAASDTFSLNSDSRLETVLDEELDQEPAGFPDPLERVNRSTLHLNQQLYHWVLNPITRAYGFAVPGPARRAVRRFLANLGCPSVLVNDLLQREWKDAAVTTARFALNSTVGLAGLLDPAVHMGLPRHEADFGQTLALAGVGSGPFLVLPALGPTTARDGLGLMVDALFRPSMYILGPGAEIVYQGTTGFVTREAQLEALRALEESAIDYYAALRSAYYQNRTAEIWRRRRAAEDGPPSLAASRQSPPPQNLSEH